MLNNDTNLNITHNSEERIMHLDEIKSFFYYFIIYLSSSCDKVIKHPASKQGNNIRKVSRKLLKNWTIAGYEFPHKMSGVVTPEILTSSNIKYEQLIFKWLTFL